MRDNGARMHKHREFAAGGEYRFSQTPPYCAIADCNHKAVATRECRQQFKRWPDYGESCRGIDRLVIKEGHRVFAHRASDIGDNTAMSSTADNLEGALTGHTFTLYKSDACCCEYKNCRGAGQQKIRISMEYCIWSNRNETHA